MPAPLTRPERRLRRPALLAVLALVAALLGSLALPGAANAASNPQADAANAWLATLVGPDGSVDDPFSGNPSLTWTANVALSLATTGTQPDALQRALGHLSENVDGYIAEGTSDPAGRLSWLILLVDATGGDPRAFGTPATDLVAALQARYGVAEPGLYGVIDEFTPVTNQSLALLALTAAGETPPTAAVDWLLAQQCDAPTSAAGAWQGYRAPSGGGLEACDESLSTNFSSADSNTTAFAVQALVATGNTGPVAAALTWLHGMQDTTAGAAAGGFGQRPGDLADPNSTALVIQAIVAAGQSPTSGWTAGGGDPLSSLQSWIIGSGAEAGALSSPFSAGFADLFATYQGVWGLAQVAFPLPQPVAPVTPTTTSTVPPAQAAAVTPAFTG